MSRRRHSTSPRCLSLRGELRSPALGLASEDLSSHSVRNKLARHYVVLDRESILSCCNASSFTLQMLSSGLGDAEKEPTRWREALKRIVREYLSLAIGLLEEIIFTQAFEEFGTHTIK